MKKFSKIFSLIIIILTSVFLCCACENKKPFVIFSSSEINQSTKPIRLFHSGERIYYALISPKGFKDGVLKVQIFKQDDKREFWGYSYYYNREVRAKNKNFYTDYVVIHNPGHYIMQAFNISDLHNPIILGDFVVQE